MTYATHSLIAAALAAALCLLCREAPLSAADAKPVKLVMMGDSVTASAAAPDGDKMPQLVEKGLNARSAGRFAWTVVNAGVGSENSEGGLGRVKGVLTKEQPQIVTIAYGLNDCHKKDPKWFEEKMRAFMDEIAKHPCKPQVVVLTATPFVNEHHFWGKDAFFVGQGGVDSWLDRQLNAVTRRLAAERGLPCIDVHRAFVGVPDWQKLMSGDGVHPNVEGNRALAAIVVKGLAAYAEANGSPKSKAAEAEKSARAKVAQAEKAAASPARRAEARKLLEEAGELCPYLAQVWAGLDRLQTDH
jgi:lysophospholipase L1-like esterase